MNELVEIEKGLYSMEYVNCDIVKFLRDMINTTNKYLEDKGIEIDFKSNINKKIIQIDVDKFERIIYLGAGSLKGMARESALKLLELTGGIVNANYDTPLGFRHGPKSVINNTTTTIFYLSNDEYTRLYDIDLIHEMSSQRKEDKIVLVGCNIVDELKELVDDYIEIDVCKYCFLQYIYYILGFHQLLKYSYIYHYILCRKVFCYKNILKFLLLTEKYSCKNI
jgi:fructoselysine-6-P-deglycase FrlB-like protein